MNTVWAYLFLIIVQKEGIMTFEYIEDTMKPQTKLLYKLFFSSKYKKDNLKQKVMIDFKRFSEIMHLYKVELPIDDQEEIHQLLVTLKDYESSDSMDEATPIFEKILTLIDEKTIEKNYEVFKENIGLNQYDICDHVKEKIRELYIRTDSYALRGRVAEAKRTWQLLMVILEQFVPHFVPLPLKSFDGALPPFPKFIQTGFEQYKGEKALEVYFSSVEIDFIGALYEESKMYYEIGQLDLGDEVWLEMEEIINDRIS